jgi:hypothetical protein
MRIAANIAKLPACWEGHSLMPGGRGDPALTRAPFVATTQATMSRGLGRIERTILSQIEDTRAGKNGYAAEALAVAAYQPGIGSKRSPTKAERVAVARAMRSLAHKYHDRIVLKGGDGRPLWLERRQGSMTSAKALRRDHRFLKSRA